MNATVSAAQSAGRSLSPQLMVVFGVIGTILGALLLFQPGIATELLMLVLGAIIVLKSLVSIVDAGRMRDDTWGWRALAGVLGLVVGLIVLAEPTMSALISVTLAFFLLGSAALVTGIMEIAAGLTGRHREWWPVVLGVLQIILAVLILLHPVTGIVIMVQFMGVMAIVLGIVAIFSAFGGRREPGLAPS